MTRSDQGGRKKRGSAMPLHHTLYFHHHSPRMRTMPLHHASNSQAPSKGLGQALKRSTAHTLSTAERAVQPNTAGYSEENIGSSAGVRSCSLSVGLAC
mmetsp:Transcript_23984/g.42284  ORF Transcript_23984/g.42284 Transcript_23984/m.42284 type:complete len:98 (+) Transcript_23984:386-679(+)